MRTVFVPLLVACILVLPLPARSMTFEDERKLAQEVVTYLDAQGVILYDQEITWPVRMISEKLADHIQKPMYSFQVHVISDRAVNAFTIPDGHIFVNLGTILFAQDLDEIAAVIAHEMGHAQLRHIPLQFERQKEITAASIIGVIAGALMSMKNPEAGAALVFSSIGGSQNLQLSYSRQHEHDSDEFARTLLSSSGYAPSAMNSFLSRMGSHSGSKDIPEYLLTHPQTPRRISGESPDAHKPKPDTYYWTLEASVLGLSLPEDEAVQRAQSIPDPYRKLALAMVETRRGQNRKALALLKDVNLPQALAYKGLNLAMIGKKDEAYPLLKQYGTSGRCQIVLAGIMEDRGEYEQAIRTLQPYQKQSIQIDYKLGILNQKLNRQTPAHVSFARYFFKTGKFQASTFHINKALEGKKDLEPGVEDELKEMQEFIKKVNEK